MANFGRQYWQGPYWLSVGRHIRDNEALENFYEPEDISFRLKDFPGPHGLGRKLTSEAWPDEYIYDAAALLASFSPKAVQAGQQGCPILVEIRLGGQNGEGWELAVIPERQNLWRELSWEETGPEIKKRFKNPLAQANSSELHEIEAASPAVFATSPDE